MLYEMIEELNLPRLLEFADGSPVTSITEWQKRRKEIITLLCEKEYGLRHSGSSLVTVTINKVSRCY